VVVAVLDVCIVGCWYATELSVLSGAAEMLLLRCGMGGAAGCLFDFLTCESFCCFFSRT